MKRYAATVLSVLALAAPAAAAASPSESNDDTPLAQIDEASWGTGVQPDTSAWQADVEASWGT